MSGRHRHVDLPAKSLSRRWFLRGLRAETLLSGLVLLTAPGSPDRVGALSLIAIALAHPGAWR